VLHQPDLGTAIIIIVTSIFVPYLLGLKKQTVILTILLMLAIIPVLWSLLLPYQKMRILCYLWPSEYFLSSFQVKQSIMAIQKGGLFGRNDVMINVPAGTTDFIFSVYAYKFGAIGIILLLALYKRLIKNIIYLAKSTSNPILSALAGSYAFLLISSIVVNMLMVTRLLPIVGLPLLLMSYGGTAFLVNILIISILVTAFRKPNTQITNNIGPDFRKRQLARLNRLSIFLNFSQWLIIFRLVFIYLN
jgi:rod shape determining protein RodA